MAERRKLVTAPQAPPPKKVSKPLTEEDLLVPEGMEIPNFLRRVPYVKYEPKLDKTV